MRRMKTTKGDRDRRSSKAARRTSRKAKGRDRHDDRVAMRVLGGTMDHELFERVLAAAQNLDLDAPWPDIASLVLPILRRVRHPYPPEATPMHVFVPPGVWTGFGIDFGPAFTHVTAKPGRALGHRPRDAARDCAREPACPDGRRASTRRADPPRRRRDDRDPGSGLGIGAHPRSGRPPPDPW